MRRAVVKWPIPEKGLKAGDAIDFDTSILGRALSASDLHDILTEHACALEPVALPLPHPSELPGHREAMRQRLRAMRVGA